MKLIFIWYALIFGQFFSSLLAQDPASINYTTKDGLISNNVYHVMQDSKGYIWLSTDKGVSKFNGTEFINYGLNEGLDGEDVFMTVEDDNRNIWIVTHHPALFILKNNHIEPFWFNDQIENNTKKKRVITSLYIREDSVIIGFQYDGMMLFGLDGNIQIDDQFEGKVVKTYGEELINYSLLGKKKNIVSTPQITLQKKDTFLIVNKNSEFKKGHRGPSLYSYRFSMQKILISNYNILYEFKGFYPNVFIYNKPIDCIMGFNEESIMIGFLGGGVKYYEDFNDEKKSHLTLFNSQSITSIIRDKNGGFWFATRGNGVIYSPTLELKHIGVSDVLVSEIQTHDDDVFVGYFNGSILKFNSKNDSVKSILRLKLKRSDSPVYFIIDSNGTLYSEILENSNYELNYNNYYFFQKEESIGYVRELISSKSGCIWMGSQSHIYKFENDALKLISYKSPEGYKEKLTCNILFESDDGTIWSGTDKGVYRYKEDEMIKFNGVPSVDIIDIKIFKKAIFFVTKFEGVYIYNGENVFTTPELISIVNINDVEVHEDKLYIVMDKIVLIMAYQNNKLRFLKYVFPFFNTNLNKISFNKDNVFLGSSNGIYKFNIDFLENYYERSPEILFSEIYIDGVKKILNEKQLGKNKFHQLDILLDKVNFNYPGVVKIKKKYFQRKAEWEIIDFNKISIKNNDNRLQSFQLVYQSTITMNILNSMFFDFNNETNANSHGWIIFLVFSGLISLWMVNTHSSLGVVVLNYLKFRSRKEEMNTLKLQALFAKMSPHFTFNVLNSIQGYILTESKAHSISFLNQYSRLLRKVLISSYQKESSLKEELLLIEKYIEIENIRFNGKINLSIDYDKEINPDRIQVPSMIMQPVIENSIKHGFNVSAKEDYFIYIFITKSRRFLEVRTRNNGSGIVDKIVKDKKQASQFSLGLEIVKERLSIVNGNINADKLFELKNVKKEGVIIGVEAIMRFPLNN